MSEEIGSVNINIDTASKIFKKVATFDEAVSDYLGDLTMFTVLSTLSSQTTDPLPAIGDYSFVDPTQWIQDKTMSIRPYDKELDNDIAVSLKKASVASSKSLFTYERPLFDSNILQSKLNHRTNKFTPPSELKQHKLTLQNIRQIAVIHLVDMIVSNSDRFPWTGHGKSFNEANLMFQLNGDTINMLPIDQGWGFNAVRAHVRKMMGLDKQSLDACLEEEMKPTQAHESITRFKMRTWNGFRFFAKHWFYQLKWLRDCFKNENPVTQTQFIGELSDVWIRHGRVIVEIVQHIATQKNHAVQHMVDEMIAKCETQKVNEMKAKRCVYLFDKRSKHIIKKNHGNKVNYDAVRVLTAAHEGILNNIRDFTDMFAELEKQDKTSKAVEDYQDMFMEKRLQRLATALRKMRESL